MFETTGDRLSVYERGETMSRVFLDEVAEGKGEKLTQLCKLLPSFRKGKPSTLSRVLRWILQGKAGPNGERVYLEALKTPGGWISTPGAVARFFKRLTPHRHDEDARTKTRKHSAALEKRAAKIGKELENNGI